ncbi:MAG TPA: radical SAM protein [bacterium]|nr:radical SAM protein [bacterium]
MKFTRRKFMAWLLTILGGGTELLANSKKGENINKSSQPLNPKKRDNFQPSYLELHKNGELQKRGQELWEMMEKCDLCPRECGANRLNGEAGICGADAKLMVASSNPHFGEEDPLVGRGGSGTIFLTHCSLRCVFCINADISQKGYGKQISIEDMANMMLWLQNRGCHNVNVVTPTHYLPHIILALDIAAEKGLNVPLVYNSSGYERVDILKYLDGIVDIYLPDFKYADSEMADKYSSGAKDYPELAKKALVEMHNQVGVAIPNQNGIMEQGLMIRHLVMPNNVSGSQEVIRWIGDNLPSNTYLNIMSQYRPVYKAHEYDQINRGITSQEYSQVIKWAKKSGLTNLEIQGY